MRCLCQDTQKPIVLSWLHRWRCRLNGPLIFNIHAGSCSAEKLCRVLATKACVRPITRCPQIIAELILRLRECIQ